LSPFSITDKTEIGKQIIENSIKQFDGYFKSEKRKHINFNDFASRYDSLRHADNDLINLLIKKCGIKKNTKILDYGCGTGNYIKGFQEAEYNDISGLDTSEKMREIALGKTGVHIYEQFSDINECFDIILFIDVIHLIKDINSLAEELYSKCADKGMVAIVTQSHEQINKRRYREFFPSVIEIDLERYHDIGTLISDFKNAGFQKNEIINFKKNKIRRLDLDFFNKVRNKCFSMFELMDEDDFNIGIKKFEEALAKNNNVINEVYAGKTILLFSKNETVASRTKHHSSANESSLKKSLADKIKECNASINEFP
jgi:SAM-dependent methyltransferase